MKKNYLFKGIFYTSIASIFWGLPQPIYFNEIKFVPSLEIVSHRSIWSFFFLFVIIFISGKIDSYYQIFQNKRKIFYLSMTGILIACNWTCFIYAISINRLQDASMGYYISPILSIGLGYLFLKEKLSILKFISILLMIISIIFLIFGLNTFPIIAIFIGLSWSFYGLIRKKIQVSAEIGLLYESGFISIFAIFYLMYLGLSGESYFFNKNYTTTLLLFFTGIITIFPLFFFNLGVKKIQLGLAGVIFYLAPTFHFITSILIFKENIEYYKLVSFVIIWLAVIIFILDNFSKKEINANNTQLLN